MQKGGLTMNDMSGKGVTVYRAGFLPIADSKHAAPRAVAVSAPQRERHTAATDPSVDRGLI
jgi:hypothetical protein